MRGGGSTTEACPGKSSCSSTSAARFGRGEVTTARRDDPLGRASVAGERLPDVAGERLPDVAGERLPDGARRDELSAGDPSSTLTARFACAVLFRGARITFARFACAVLFGASGTDRFLPFADGALESATSLLAARRATCGTRAELSVRFAMVETVSRNPRAPAPTARETPVHAHAIFALSSHRLRWHAPPQRAPMSWLMSKLYDRVMADAERACLVAWRADLLRGLAGAVLEVGAGTGANLRHYPPDVTRLVLAEPDPHMRRELELRLSGHTPPPELVDATSEALPFPDAIFDAVVITLVLCSVPDPDRTLAELRRVLRPGGALIYLEHVAADEDPDRLAWQHRIEPVWRHLAGNCHLTRRTADSIRRAGFRIERESRESMRKAFFFTRPTVRGLARSPA
jgi:ubiquinone/menaquinone biosynthesis C-methylase UbiE